MTSAIEIRADGWQRDYGRLTRTVAELAAENRALRASLGPVPDGTACICGRTIAACAEAGREASRG